MALHPARHVERVRADDADAHGRPVIRSAFRRPVRRSVPRREPAGVPRSSSQSFCSMCQSGGCSAMPAASASATVWVSACTRTSSAPDSVRHRQRAGHPAARPVALVPERHHEQRRAGAQGEQRRAGRHPGPAAEERRPRRRGRTGRGRPAAAPRGPRRAASTSTSIGGRSPPVAGMISMPSDSRKATNRWYSALRLEPLGHRGERPAVGADPGPGAVPVAGVRQRDHAAGAGRRPPRRAGGRCSHAEVVAGPAAGCSAGSRNASSQ